jgi:hypothetical protein
MQPVVRIAHMEALIFSLKKGLHFCKVRASRIHWGKLIREDPIIETEIHLFTRHLSFAYLARFASLFKIFRNLTHVFSCLADFGTPRVVPRFVSFSENVTFTRIAAKHVSTLSQVIGNCVNYLSTFWLASHLKAEPPPPPPNIAGCYHLRLNIKETGILRLLTRQVAGVAGGGEGTASASEEYIFFVPDQLDQPRKESVSNVLCNLLVPICLS